MRPPGVRVRMQHGALLSSAGDVCGAGASRAQAPKKNVSEEAAGAAGPGWRAPQLALNAVAPVPSTMYRQPAPQMGASAAMAPR